MEQKDKTKTPAQKKRTKALPANALVRIRAKNQ